MFQGDIQEDVALEQRYDFPRPTALYRHMEQGSSSSDQAPVTSLRPPELKNNIQQPAQSAEEASKPLTPSEDQDSAQPLPSKKKPQEVKSVPLKDLLKDVCAYFVIHPSPLALFPGHSCSSFILTCSLHETLILFPLTTQPGGGKAYVLICLFLFSSRSSVLTGNNSNNKRCMKVLLLKIRSH